MKIGFKLTLFFVIFLIAVMSVSTIVFFFQGSEAIEKRMQSQLRSVSVLKSNQLERFVLDKTETIERIASNDIILEIKNNNFYHENIKNFLIDELSNENHFIEFFILDLDGNVYISTDEIQEGKIKSDEDYFINGLDETFVKSFYYSVTFQKPSMVISTPIEGDGGNNLGVLVGRIKLEEVSEIMSERSGLGETGETYLVNKFNFLVTKSRFIEDIEFKKVIYTDAVRECLKGKNGHKHYDDYRGIPVGGIYTWIDEREICLIAKINQEEAFEPIKRLRYELLLIFLGILFLVVILGLLLSRTITRPIVKLRDDVIKVGKGNLKIKIFQTSQDEVGDLARTFSKMTNDLRKSRRKLEEYSKNLEKKVKERTKELEQKNNELNQFNKLAVGRELKMVELKKKIRELEEKLKKK